MTYTAQIRINRNGIIHSEPKSLADKKFWQRWLVVREAFDHGDFTELPAGPIPAPRNLMVSDYVTRQGTTIVVVSAVSMTPSNDQRVT